MNLVKFLLKEHSKATTAKIVKYVNGNPARFQELVDVYLKGPGQITQRAAWPLSYCVEHNPELIYPHLSKILKFLHKPGNHDAVKRNTTRLLQYVNIPTRMQGNVATICFDYLNNPKEPVAVRIFSMTVLANLAQVQPALQNELKEILEFQMPFGSAGYVSRATKILKKLKV